MAADLPFASASKVVEPSSSFSSIRTRAARDELDANHDGRRDSAVVQAHRYGQGADDASRKGDHAAATELHLAAARDFFRAAEQVKEHGVLASSLLLLADSHAARAEKGAIRLRLSSDGRRSLKNPSSSSGSSSSRDLTPAEAYRAASSGVNASGTRGKGFDRGGGGLSAGDGRRNAADSEGAIGPDMDDSIMRGTGASSGTDVAAGTGAGHGDSAAELAKQFRPQRDDLLELERQLAKLGLESKTGGPGGRARHRLANGNPGGAPHLSSALGDSFFFLNKSVIFGGAGGTGGLTGLNGGANAPHDNGGAGPPTWKGVDGVEPGGHVTDRAASSPRFSESTAGPRTAAAAALDGSGNNGARMAPVRSEAGGGGGGGGDSRRRGAGGEQAPPEVMGSNGARRSAAGGGQARGSEVGGGAGVVSSGDWGSRGGEGGMWSLSDAENARRAKEQEAQQGEIMRLLTCLKTLGDENVSLMRECEDRDKVRQESESVREEMRRFQLKYHERFTLLKKTLDEVMRSYPQLGAPGAGAAIAGGGTTGADGVRTTEEVQRLTQSNRKLTEQVRKYENYYKELCQKAESKRKEQLSQAKAARQQQLAHHPSFGQQQQQQQQQLQQQAPQQQRVQRRLSPAAAVPRRAQQQQQQQALPSQTRRSSSAPSAQQQHAAAAAVPGSHPQQHYPAFSQQHFRQNQQQQQQQQHQQQQLAHSSQGALGYRGSGVAQAPAAAAAIQGGMVVRGAKSSAAAQQSVRGVAENRSAGLVEESDV